MKNLTNEQLTEIKNLKSIDELKAFLTKENITLTDNETAKASSYLASGKSELADDELEMVAGGGDKEDEYKAQAYSDGRTHPLSIPLNIVQSEFCSCFIEQVWAREFILNKVPKNGKEKSYEEHRYYDCKCYRCGHMESVYTAKFVNY